MKGCTCRRVRPLERRLPAPARLGNASLFAAFAVVATLLILCPSNAEAITRRGVHHQGRGPFRQWGWYRRQAAPATPRRRSPSRLLTLWLLSNSPRRSVMQDLFVWHTLWKWRQDTGILSAVSLLQRLRGGATTAGAPSVPSLQTTASSSCANVNGATQGTEIDDGRTTESVQMLDNDSLDAAVPATAESLVTGTYASADAANDNPDDVIVVDLDKENSSTTTPGAQASPLLQSSASESAQQRPQVPVATQETTASLPLWKAELPPLLQRKGPRTLQYIQLGPIDIFLLGTAHVSLNSTTDVQELLDAVHPHAIMVELCEARIPLLEGGLSSPDSKAGGVNGTSEDEKNDDTFWERLDAIQQAQGGSRLQALSTHLLTRVQEDYATELGVELGGEFQCAHRYWLEHNSANESRIPRPHLILGDRPMHLTLIRAWESLGWWPKIKVVLGLMWSSTGWGKPSKEEIRAWLEQVMAEESDILTQSFAELKNQFPSLYRAIIDERDAWLAAKVVQSCRALAQKQKVLQQRQEAQATMRFRSHYGAPSQPQANERMRLVAIVGAGHVPGICQWLTNSTQPKSPEAILSELVVTKRWANDDYVQNQAIPTWVREVTELQQMPDGAWSWGQASEEQTFVSHNQPAES